MYLNLYMAKATDSRCRVISCVYMGVDGLLLYVLNNANLVTPLSMATHAVIFSTLRERTRGRDCRDDPRFAQISRRRQTNVRAAGAAGSTQK